MSKLGWLKISIRDNIFKGREQPCGLLWTNPFEVAQLGCPAALTTLGRSWIQSHIWEIWYLSISTPSWCCWELPCALSDALMYLQFTLKSIGIDGVWKLQKTESCCWWQCVNNSSGTGTLRKCWLLCSPSNVQWNKTPMKTQGANPTMKICVGFIEKLSWAI